ncbi:hypothetical protein P7C70_g5154, partial [Phenoliferia sp. Uapishka_3]
MAVEVSPAPSPDSKGKRKAADDLPLSDGADAVVEAAGEDIKEETKVEEDPDEEILLVTIPAANIVGLKNYRGIASLRQKQAIELRRDLTNIYDKNAVEVRHMNKGMKIGYLSKTLAGRIAPLIDQRIITTKCVAGAVPTNTVAVESTPFALSLYGPRYLLKDPRLDYFFPQRAKAAAEKKAMEAEILKAMKLSEKLGESRGLDALMAQSILIEKADRPTGDLLGELFKEGVGDPALLPEHPCPPGKKDKTMRSDLMGFQKQGLAWMINMEHPTLPKEVDDPPVQLWVKKKDAEGEFFWYNVATEDTQREKPLLKRGGILADEMGLGKTMQTIALICTDDTGEGVLPEPEEPDERFDDMTLIVCPLSVTSNWTDQFHHHVGSKRLKWHVYHGEGREVSKKQLRKFDVVITTYQTLALEHLAEVKEVEKHSLKKAKLAKPVEGTLHAIKWRRVVLDEGHVIKNPKAKMSVACADLKAERRWILTGTPIINSTTDLGAMMTFLKLCRPLDQRAMWTMYVENRVKEDGPDGAKLLRAIVSSTTLRRTKDMTDTTGKRLVSLPEISFYLHRVKLQPEAQSLYDEVLGVLQGIVKGFLNKGTASMQYSNVLVYLLRLRQLACDPSLCPKSFIEDVRASRLANDREVATNVGPVVSPAEISRLQGVLRRMTQEANAECGLCFDVPVEPRITACGHLFCAGCIEEHIDYAGVCPMDQNPLDRTCLVEPGPERDASSDEDEVLAWQAQAGNDALSHAAKTQQLLMLLKATEPGVKSLIFSQWTTHLNCIEAALARAGVPSCRFDGSMTQAKREAVIAEFSESKKSKKTGGKTPPVVMLISLKAGALGLNLTCASQVFLMDPWWQASIESQDEATWGNVETVATSIPTALPSKPTPEPVKATTPPPAPSQVRSAAVAQLAAAFASSCPSPTNTAPIKPPPTPTPTPKYKPPRPPRKPKPPVEPESEEVKEEQPQQWRRPTVIPVAPPIPPSPTPPSFSGPDRPKSAPPERRRAAPPPPVKARLATPTTAVHPPVSIPQRPPLPTRPSIPAVPPRVETPSHIDYSTEEEDNLSAEEEEEDAYNSGRPTPTSSHSDVLPPPSAPLSSHRPPPTRARTHNGPSATKATPTWSDSKTGYAKGKAMEFARNRRNCLSPPPDCFNRRPPPPTEEDDQGLRIDYAPLEKPLVFRSNNSNDLATAITQGAAFKTKPPVMSSHDVFRQDWDQLWEDIAETARIELRASAGLSVATLPLMPIFGAGFAVSTLAERKLRAKRVGPTCKLIEAWNVQFFRPRKLDVYALSLSLSSPLKLKVIHNLYSYLAQDSLRLSGPYTTPESKKEFDPALARVKEATNEQDRQKALHELEKYKGKFRIVVQSWPPSRS